MKRLLLVIVATGCQGGTTKDAQPAAAPDARAGFGARDARDEIVEPDQPVVPDETEAPPKNPGAEELGAIPAWRAVVDRDMYLARRGDRGVVFGRIGSGTGTGTGIATQWLIDETEGNGALAIRVDFGAMPPVVGTRVAVGGAWALDDARRWYWQAEAVTPLPSDDAPAANAPDPPVAPGLVVAIADPPPPRSKVRLPDKVKDGDLMQFTVVSIPRRIGDGWGVSDQRWGTLLGYVRLPGEHGSYGGHDLRTADERWTLKKQTTYWVRVGKVRRRGTEPPTFEAVTPPVRFP